jgi:hypothetical protein
MRHWKSETPWVSGVPGIDGKVNRVWAAPTVEDWNRFEEWLERVSSLPIPLLTSVPRPPADGEQRPATLVEGLPYRLEPELEINNLARVDGKGPSATCAPLGKLST